MLKNQDPKSSILSSYNFISTFYRKNHLGPLWVLVNPIDMKTRDFPKRERHKGRNSLKARIQYESSGPVLKRCHSRKRFLDIGTPENCAENAARTFVYDACGFDCLHCCFQCGPWRSCSPGKCLISGTAIFIRTSIAISSVPAVTYTQAHNSLLPNAQTNYSHLVASWSCVSAPVTLLVHGKTVRYDKLLLCPIFPPFDAHYHLFRLKFRLWLCQSLWFTHTAHRRSTCRPRNCFGRKAISSSRFVLLQEL